VKYMELLKRQKTPTQSTAKTALTPFGSKGSAQGSHFQAKKELTEAEKLTQLQSSDWRWFCDSHERSMQDLCSVKHNSLDPMTDCIGWRLKQGKKVDH
jgi:hypothetical protein